MFGTDVDAQILEWARASEEEICGVIVDGNPVLLDNMSETPETNFEIAEIPDDAQAVFHSHPGGPFHPSKLDMQQQYATALPWGIASYHPRHSEIFWFGDGAPKQKLIGRGFRHGVSDCYELIRDFYQQTHGIELMHVPRSWEWWNDGEKLYTELFREAGFKQIAVSEIRPGDAFLATIRSKTPNHAGVYLGNDLILHHTAGREGYDPSRLSTVEPASRWFNFLSGVLTYENSEIDRTVGQGVWPAV